MSATKNEFSKMQAARPFDFAPAFAFFGVAGSAGSATASCYFSTIALAAPATTWASADQTKTVAAVATALWAVLLM